MNCHHIHLSELGVSEAVTREEFPGKCFSALPLNLKLKADKGGCKSPWCPIRGTSPQSCRLRHSSEQSFLCPRLVCSADTSFTAKRNGRGCSEGGCACAGSMSPSGTEREGLGSLRSPQIHHSALQLFLDHSCAPILCSISVELQLLFLVFHKYCSN